MMDTVDSIYEKYLNKLGVMFLLFTLFSCQTQKEPVMECMIDSFISLYEVDSTRVDLIAYEYQSVSDSLITFGIYTEAKGGNNKHPESLHFIDDYFYYSKYKGFRVYLKRNYHVGGRTWDSSKVNKKKYLSNNLKWKKMKSEYDSVFPSISDITELIGVEYDIKNKKINNVLEVMGYEKFSVNDSCPYIVVDKESRVNDFYP